MGRYLPKYRINRIRTIRFVVEGHTASNPKTYKKKAQNTINTTSIHHPPPQKRITIKNRKHQKTHMHSRNRKLNISINPIPKRPLKIKPLQMNQQNNGQPSNRQPFRRSSRDFTPRTSPCIVTVEYFFFDEFVETFLEVDGSVFFAGLVVGGDWEG